MKARQRLEQARRTLAARPWAAAAAGVAAIAIVAGFLLLADWRASAARERANLWELHTLEVQLAAQKLLGAVQEAEANQRAFVFVGRDAYLEPYRDAAAEARAEVDALKRLTIDNPVQQQRLSVIDELMRSRLDALEDGVALVRQNRRAVAMARLRAGAAQGRSHQLRAQIEGLVQEEQRLLIQRRAAADRAQAQDERLAWMILALVAVLLAAMSWISQLGLRAARQAREQSERTAMAERVQALLQEKVDAATADLRRSEAQLRQAQKMEAIGQLAGGVAHDFNNMLAIIIGSLELAQRRLADNEDVQRLIAAAMDGARRAAALTQRILAFSRQQPLDPKVLDANRLVADMSELLRRTLGETVKFESVLAGGLWPVRADANQLENALVNLAVNARDAMENGGKLTIETGNAYLDDAYARTRAEVRPGQYVAISVTDTGVGMDKEIIEKAFDPFFTTKGVGKGTGLGLSQVFGFVKQSGGHVAIYSERGSGTTVKIYLPRHFEEAAAKESLAAPPPAARGAREEIILVVEDDEKVRLMSVEALRELGYTVRHARDGAHALAVLRDTPGITLLFTDIVMPDMGGRALADAAKALAPHLKILFTTGYTRNAVVHNGVLDPGVAFLPKPFTLEQIAQKVRAVLDEN